jgi:hypothetical protein
MHASIGVNFEDWRFGTSRPRYVIGIGDGVKSVIALVQRFKNFVFT